MTSLHHIHEAGIMYNLGERSKLRNQRPYTFMVSTQKWQKIWVRSHPSHPPACLLRSPPGPFSSGVPAGACRPTVLVPQNLGRSRQGYTTIPHDCCGSRPRAPFLPMLFTPLSPPVAPPPGNDFNRREPAATSAKPGHGRLHGSPAKPGGSSPLRHRRGKQRHAPGFAVSRKIRRQ